MSADGRLIIREEEEDAATAKMEEEESTKGEACLLWERSGTCSSSTHSYGHSLTHSARWSWERRR